MFYVAHVFKEGRRWLAEFPDAQGCRARQDLGLTQKQLAERAGVSQQQIAKLEDPDENPTIKTLSKVSEALGVTVDVSFVSAA